MSQELTSTEALSYLAEIIDAARAGGAPREHIQALQMAREALDADTGLSPVSPEEVSKMQKELAQTRQYLREALDIAKANARLFDDACAERDEAIKCIKDYEMYYGRGDEERARHVLEKWMEEESK